LRRRFGNAWRRPDLLLIDGGWPQVNAAKAVLAELGLAIPLVGLAKGPERKRDDVISDASEEVLALYAKYLPLLVRVRDEAHRFAITYHRKLRSMKLTGRA
jgi:excinuclease ABC subunit C